MDDTDILSRQALNAAMAENQQLGHENYGSLSLDYGLLPTTPPLLSLPEAFSLWDEMAVELPHYYQHQLIRDTFNKAPVLDANDKALPDEYLCRAATLMGVMAHAYYWLQSEKVTAMPDSIMLPWKQICRRLERKQTGLTYSDLILNNWTLNHSANNERTLEHLELLIETVGQKEERIFYGAQVEMAYRATPLIGAMVCAQEAAVKGDIDGLMTELETMVEAVHQITMSFQRIKLEKHHEFYCDPVTWGKDVAPLAVSFQEGVEGPSGTSAPYFHLLDIFLSRRHYMSKLGQDQKYFRKFHYSKHLSQFAYALGDVDIQHFVAETDSKRLVGSYRNLVEAYAGATGLLGVHRTKVYGYLTTAFKIGRTVTVGGSTTNNSYLEKAWQRVDALLEDAQNERQEKFLLNYSMIHPIAKKPCHHVEDWPAVNEITFDISNTSIKYKPGDNCEILPITGAKITEKMLTALQAEGDELIQLNKQWKKKLSHIRPYAGKDYLTLKQLLLLSDCRLLTHEIAIALYSVTGCDWIENLLETHRYDQYELWQVLNYITENTTFNIKRLFKAEPWNDEHLCHIIQPAKSRYYSITSLQAETPDKLSITVAGLAYQASDAAESDERLYGSCSSYLNNFDINSPDIQGMPARIVKNFKFTVPKDDTAPMVMFAGGSGVSPFISFIKHRIHSGASGDNILLYSVKTKEFILHRDLLAQWVQQGKLKCCINFSQEDGFVDCKNNNEFKVIPHPPCHIQDIIMEKQHQELLLKLLQSANQNMNTSFYICGLPGFADTVIRTLWKLIASNFNESRFNATNTEMFISQLVSRYQFMLSIYTSLSPVASGYNRGYEPYKLSEIALHNNDKNGYWIIIYDQVYDVSSFMNLHPGGNTIIKHVAGIDATNEFIGINHHNNPSINSMLAMYKIGYVDKPKISNAWTIRMTDDGLHYVNFETFYKSWIKYFHLVIEMENGWLIERESNLKKEVKQDKESIISYVANMMNEHHGFYQRIFSVLFSKELQELWSMVLGFFDPNKNFGKLIAVMRAHLVNIENHNANYETGFKYFKSRMQEDKINLNKANKLVKLYEKQLELDNSLIERLKLSMIEGTTILEVKNEQEMLSKGKEVVDIVESFSGVADFYTKTLVKIYDKIARHI